MATDEKLTNESKLYAAVATIADIIDKMAVKMKQTLDEDDGDVKKLKELTLTAKELAGVIRGLSAETETQDTIRVTLEGETKEWAT